MYIFLRETKILLEYGGRFIYLDTTGDISCDQTFKETSISRRNLHSKNNFFKFRQIRAHNTISGSISLYITKSKQELLFLELAGWNCNGNTYTYPDFETTIPEVFNIYLVNNDRSFRLNNCIITSIDFSFSKTFCGGLNISFDSSSLEEISENYSLYPQGEHLSITPITSILGSSSLNTISVNASFTRSISYLNSETIHNSSSIIENKRAIITDANFAINLVTYLSEPTIDSIDSVKFSQSGLTLEMNNALITRRNTIMDVYQSAFDITPTNTTNYINLGGL